MLSGVVAEFETPDALEKAHATLLRGGYQRLETWTPYQVRSLVRAEPASPVPSIMLGAGLSGGGLGYWLQWWLNARDFPIDVGGRPLDSAPAFIPITFESAVLATALAGFVAMLWCCGLPRLHHPLFEVEGFESASIDHFWLGIDDANPLFDPAVSEELARLGAVRCVRLGGSS